MRFLVLFEQEFAEVHDANHRRIGLRRHLDEIELRSLGEIECFESIEHPNLSAVRSNPSHFRRGDLFVASNALACNSYKSILQQRAPVALDFHAEPTNKVF